LALAAILVIGVSGWLWNGNHPNNLEITGSIGSITGVVNQEMVCPESVPICYPSPQVQCDLAGIYKTDSGVIDARVSDHQRPYRNVAAGSEDGFAAWRLLFNVAPIYSKPCIVRYLRSEPSPKIYKRNEPQFRD
jgi:hypothetical protein